MLALTFWSDRYDGYTLRRIASGVDREVKSIDDVSATKVIGGEQRQLGVLLEPVKMAGYNVAPAGIEAALERANQQLQVGSFAAGNRESRCAFFPGNKMEIELPL